MQDKSGSKMVVIQDGIYANAPEKPLRISGDPKQIEVRARFGVSAAYVTSEHRIGPLYRWQPSMFRDAREMRSS